MEKVGFAGVVPPRFAEIEVKGEAWEITLRSVVAPGCRVAIGLGVVALAADVWVYAHCVMRETGWTPGVIAGAVVSCLLMPVLLITALVGLLGPALSGSRVLFDGKTLSLGNTDGFARVPIEDVRGIRAYTLARRRPDLDVERGPWPRVRLVRTPVLEVMLPQGGLRVMTSLDEEKVRWLAEVIPQGLPGKLGRSWDGAERASLPRASMLGRRGRLMMIALALGTGAVFLGGSLWTIGRGARSWKWPTVRGEVVHSVYDEQRDERGGTSYRVEFKYRYDVGGRSFDGESIGFFRGDDEAVVKRLVTGHPEHSAVTVYYDPADPGDAVVLPGPSPWLWFFVPLGLLQAAFAVPLMSEIPTREEAEFARRYASHPAEVKGGLAMAEEGLRWEVPEEVFRYEVRAMRRACLWSGARASGICFVVTAAVAVTLGPRLPGMPWRWLVAIFTAFPGVALALPALALVRPKPARYRVTEAGIVLPQRDRPLIRWRAIDSYELTPHAALPRYGMLVLNTTVGRRRSISLPADSNLASDVMERVASRLPRREPAPACSPVSGGDWVVGLLIVGAFAAAAGPLICHWLPTIRREGYGDWIRLGIMVAGPGTMYALHLRGRRAGLPLFVMAGMLNLFAVLAAFVTALLIRALGWPGG